MSGDIATQSSNLEIFLLRNVVIIIIMVIVDPFCVVRLQLLTQEALVIKSGSDVGMYVLRSRMSERENKRAESERENRRAESERENGRAESERENGGAESE